ncbi:AAA family ATPase [Archangium sp.]|uniref:AAA family ATPase n=1 Tax=Archangium sp. TaxID=1872627 RepID=UPI00286C0696|nr:AAA family ATPase [Archangium sp.]
MIRKIHIRSFKSILDDTLELGRINVFIGENGAGKSNLLEALATAGAAIDGELGVEELYTRGVRIAKPSITISSFLQKKPAGAVRFTLFFEAAPVGGKEESPQLKLILSPEAPDDIDAGWFVEFSSPSSTMSMTPAQELAAHLRSTRSQEEIENLARWWLAKHHEQFERKTLPDVQKQLKTFCIYNLNPLALRGIQNVSRRTPLGIHGENLDVFLEGLSPKQRRELVRYSKFIPWFDDLLIDTQDELKFKGHKLGRSTSRLYFRDRFMRRGNNVFSAENANEGILHILFYLVLFLSDKTPPIFGIDNIETALNPQLCRELMKSLAALAKAHDKQALITTHNPAVLDGLNLHDDDQRLFVVYRNDQGHTVARRLKMKPDTGGTRYKLSELWMNGHLGGLPKTF